MNRPSYKNAILWIVENDDTEWLDDETPITSVSAALVADLFGVSDQKIIKDLNKALSPMRKP